MAESLFTSQTPAGGFNDGTPGITTSTTLKFAVAGTIDKIRWYVVNPFNGGTWTGLCWEVTGTDAGGAGTGTLLNAGGDAAGFTPTVDAWNEITLASPISVVTNKLYRVGMHNDSRYCLTNNFFNGTDLTNGNITAHQNGADPLGNGWAIRQGAFVVSATTTAYPTAVGTSASYFVDVVFTPASGDGAIAPSGTAVTVALGQPSTADSALTIAPSGTAVASALGQPSLSQPFTVAPSGIAVPATAGAPSLADGAMSPSPSGIAVPATAGQPSLAQPFTVAPSGIAVPATAGQPRVAMLVPGTACAPSGISIPVALGVPLVRMVHRGNWGSLRSIYQQNLAELERVRTEPIRDCPNHGWPLEPGRTPGTVHCKFGGEVFDLHGNPVLIN